VAVSPLQQIHEESLGNKAQELRELGEQVINTVFLIPLLHP